MKQPLLEAAEKYADLRSKGAPGTNSEFYKDEAKFANEYSATKSIFEEKAANFDSDKQFLMEVMSTYEFREAGEDKDRFLKNASEKFDNEQKAWAFISGEDRSVENARAANKQITELFNRTLDALIAAGEEDATHLRDFALALDSERTLAYQASLPQ